MLEEKTLRSIGISASLIGVGVFLFFIVYVYKTTLEIQNLRLDNKLKKRDLNEPA